MMIVIRDGFGSFVPNGLFFFWNSFNPWLIGWWKVEKSEKAYSIFLPKQFFQAKMFPCYTQYSWWKKSCYIRLTTWDVKNIVNDGINYQPQLVSTDFFHQQQSRHLQLDSKWWMSPSPPWQQKNWNGLVLDMKDTYVIYNMYIQYILMLPPIHIT